MKDLGEFLWGLGLWAFAMLVGIALGYLVGAEAGAVTALVLLWVLFSEWR